MNPTTQNHTLEDLVLRRLQLKTQIDNLQGEVDSIDEKIRAVGIGAHHAGLWDVTVSPNRRLDAKKLEQAYPVASNPGLYKPAIDTAAVRHHIAEADLEEYYTEYAPRVTIK